MGSRIVTLPGFEQLAGRRLGVIFETWFLTSGMHWGGHVGGWEIEMRSPAPRNFFCAGPGTGTAIPPDTMPRQTSVWLLPECLHWESRQTHGLFSAACRSILAPGGAACSGYLVGGRRSRCPLVSCLLMGPYSITPPSNHNSGIRPPPARPLGPGNPPPPARCAVLECDWTSFATCACSCGSCC